MTANLPAVVTSAAPARRRGRTETEKLAELTGEHPPRPAPRRRRRGPRRVTAGWLAGRGSDRTREAYARELPRWIDWCAAQGLDPLTVRLVDLDGYRWHIEHPTGENANPPSPASVARHLSTISSWYHYLFVCNGVLNHNPAEAMQRPKVDRDTSQTIGMSRTEGLRFRAELANESPRDRALLSMAVTVGLRVAEMVNADVGSYGHNAGYRTITVIRKGGKRYSRTVPPGVVADLDEYLQQRATEDGVRVDELAGPLFATSTGHRMDRWAVKKIIQRVARRAEIPSADRLTPHSLRHTFATLYLDAGGSLRDLQALDWGHADTRTTRRYDRARYSLARDPSFVVDAALSKER